MYYSLLDLVLLLAAVGRITCLADLKAKHTTQYYRAQYTAAAIS